MRTTLRQLGVSAAVLALVAGLATGTIDPTAVARALSDVVRSLGTWAYAGVGGMAFLETGAFVGLVVPGETVVVVGGVAASHGDVSLPLIGLVAWIGAWIGDATSFHLGRRYGAAVIRPIARRLRISEQRLASLERSLARHGGKTVLVGRFVRALAPFMAGASGMRYRDLAPWSLAGSGAWAFAFTLVGYQFAGAVESASRRTSLVLAVVAAAVAVLLVLRHRRRARIATRRALPVQT
jgi:membrane protein DedA with SNARE-associated domain